MSGDVQRVHLNLEISWNKEDHDSMLNWDFTEDEVKEFILKTKSIWRGH